jgi:N-terminal TM domain of oligopeptide transport permease C
MTELRGESSDVSSDAIVPLQVDAASGPEQVISEKALETGARSLGANAWRDLRRRPMFWISLALIVIFVLMAIFPQLFTSKDPTFADLSKARQTPSADAWFGYDAQGYDVYARTVYGARASVSVGILATLFCLFFGSATGIIAGYRGGWLDSVVGRIAEVFLAIPLLLGGILFLYTFPTSWIPRSRSPSARSPSSSLSSPGLSPPELCEPASCRLSRTITCKPRARSVPRRTASSIPTSCPTRWLR